MPVLKTWHNCSNLGAPTGLQCLHSHTPNLSVILRLKSFNVVHTSPHQWTTILSLFTFKLSSQASHSSVQSKRMLSFAWYRLPYKHPPTLPQHHHIVQHVVWPSVYYVQKHGMSPCAATQVQSSSLELPPIGLSAWQLDPMMRTGSVGCYCPSDNPSGLPIYPIQHRVMIR